MSDNAAAESEREKWERFRTLVYGNSLREYDSGLTFFTEYARDRILAAIAAERQRAERAETKVELLKVMNRAGLRAIADDNAFAKCGHWLRFVYPTVAGGSECVACERDALRAEVARLKEVAEAAQYAEPLLGDLLAGDRSDVRTALRAALARLSAPREEKP